MTGMLIQPSNGEQLDQSLVPSQICICGTTCRMCGHQHALKQSRVVGQWYPSVPSYCYYSLSGSTEAVPSAGVGLC